VATITLFAATASAGIIDGDFENGNVAVTGYQAVWNPQGSFGLSIGVSQNSGADLPQAGAWFAFFGDAVAPILNDISQTFATNVGDSYTLTYWVAIKPISASDENSGNSHDNQTQLAVGLTGNGFTTTLFPEDDTYMQDYTEYTRNFTATAANTSIEFAGIDDWNTLMLLDSISVVDNGPAGNAPEPATFLLAGGALVLAGITRKRKRS
jgi:PEP-CTERM motif